jgi:hypothetical protein
MFNNLYMSASYLAYQNAMDNWQSAQKEYSNAQQAAKDQQDNEYSTDALARKTAEAILPVSTVESSIMAGKAYAPYVRYLMGIKSKAEKAAINMAKKKFNDTINTDRLGDTLNRKYQQVRQLVQQRFQGADADAADAADLAQMDDPVSKFLQNPEEAPEFDTDIPDQIAGRVSALSPKDQAAFRSAMQKGQQSFDDDLAQRGGQFPEQLTDDENFEKLSGQMMKEPGEIRVPSDMEQFAHQLGYGQRADTWNEELNDYRARQPEAVDADEPFAQPDDAPPLVEPGADTEQIGNEAARIAQESTDRLAGASSDVERQALQRNIAKANRIMDHIQGNETPQDVHDVANSEVTRPVPEADPTQTEGYQNLEDLKGEIQSNMAKNTSDLDEMQSMHDQIARGAEPSDSGDLADMQQALGDLKTQVANQNASYQGKLNDIDAQQRQAVDNFNEGQKSQDYMDGFEEKPQSGPNDSEYAKGNADSDNLGQLNNYEDVLKVNKAAPAAAQGGASEGAGDAMAGDAGNAASAGADVATTGADAAAGVAAGGAEAGLDAAAGALLSTAPETFGAGAVAAGVLSLGGLLASVFAPHKQAHSAPPPAQLNLGRVTSQTMGLL